MPKPERLKLRQTQEIHQELTRSQAGVKGKGKGAEVPLQQEQGIGAFTSKYQPQPFEGEDDKWREWARVFRSWSRRFFGGALAEIYEHVEGHRNGSACQEMAKRSRYSIDDVSKFEGASSTSIPAGKRAFAIAAARHQKSSLLISAQEKSSKAQ